MGNIVPRSCRECGAVFDYKRTQYCPVCDTKAPSKPFPDAVVTADVAHVDDE